MSKKGKIEIKSDDVNEILSRAPGWTVRWGNTFILAIVTFFLIGSALFRYPDKLSAPITVTSENLPAQLMAKTTGRVQELFKSDGDEVSKGDVIAMIENSASFSDYVKLTNSMDSLFGNGFLVENLVVEDLPVNLQLGDMQDAYNQFLSRAREYSNFINLDYHRKKSILIKRELEAQRSMIRQYNKQMSISAEQIEIVSRRYSRDSSLLLQKVISQSDFDNTKAAKLSTKQDYENVRRSLDDLKLNALQSEQSLLDLELDKEKQKSNLLSGLSGDMDLLKAAIRKWEQDYLLISPLNGKLSFTRFWQRNQNVTEGDAVFTVVPNKEANIKGKIFLPLEGAGKVKIGQKVNIKLDNFPYMEFGMVEVKVLRVSSVPALVDNKQVYVIDVLLPRKLITNYGRELPFSEEMRGTAEIITEDLSILQRIVFPVRHILKSKML
ncbi:MAG: HlyD family efflux transporter periplasmic adaptor subunit [Rikenellaceae bacterium]|nr:HlyD family efflux transporter periplasmic adaptor subunit [Rikenellaceae bacterium]